MSTTIIWQIDDSGARANVLTRLKAQSFDKLVEAAKGDVIGKTAIANEQKDNNTYRDRVVIAQRRLDGLDDAERGAFDRALAYACSEVEACRSQRVGVTIRSLVDFDDGSEDCRPHVTISVHVSEYPVGTVIGA